MFKKIVAAAIAFCMIYAANAYAEENEYVWAEAECGAMEGFVSSENDSASEGMLMTLYQTNEGGRVDMKLEVTRGGAYDIWVLSTAGNIRNCSAFKWSLNGSEPTEYKKTGESNPVVYEQTISSASYSMVWSRVAVGEWLSEGENELSYIVDTKANGGSRRYCAAIDCAVAVPSEIMWQPDGSLNKPERTERPFSWIELENPSNQTIIGKSESKSASGGYMLSAYSLSPEGGNKDGEILTYDFITNTDGEYDIWYLGSASYAAAAHLSGMYWDIDDIPEKDDAHRDNTQQTGETIMNSAGGTSDIPLYWRKIGTRELTAGEHSLNLRYCERTLDSAGRYFLWADCAVIIPSSMNWSPAVNTEEHLPDYDAAYLDAQYIVDKVFSGDYSAVKNDISIQQTMPTAPLGSNILTESSNRDVLSDDGKVTRPFFDQSDVEIAFIVSAERFGKTVQLKVPVSIIKMDKYTVENLVFTDGSGNEINSIDGVDSIYAKADVKLNVSPETDINGIATLVLAFYNDSGALIGIETSENKVTETAAELVAGGQLCPEVKTVKAYVINGFSLANQLCEAVVIE